MVGMTGDQKPNKAVKVRLPAAGRRPSPQTLGWEQIVMATGRRETRLNPSLKGPSDRPDPNGLPVCQTHAKACEQVCVFGEEDQNPNKRLGRTASPWWQTKDGINTAVRPT